MCAMVASTAALEFFLRLYLGHLAEAARAGRDAVALYGASGTPRLTFALAVALIRHGLSARYPARLAVTRYGASGGHPRYTRPR